MFSDLVIAILGRCAFFKIYNLYDRVLTILNIALYFG